MNEPVLQTLKPLEEIELEEEDEEELEEEEDNEIKEELEPPNEPLSPPSKSKRKLSEKPSFPQTLSVNSIESIYDEIKTADELTPPTR